MKVVDYNISNCGNPETFYIGDVYDVLASVVGLKSEILANAVSGNLDTCLKLGTANDSNISGIRVCENGIVLTIQNTIPSDANRYDDFSSAKLYLFDNGEIHYILSVVDRKYGEKIKVDEQAISGLDLNLGKEINLKGKDSLVGRLFSSGNKAENAKIVSAKIESLLNSVDNALLEKQSDRGR